MEARVHRIRPWDHDLHFGRDPLFAREIKDCSVNVRGIEKLEIPIGQHESNDGHTEVLL